MWISNTAFESDIAKYWLTKEIVSNSSKERSRQATIVAELPSLFKSLAYPLIGIISVFSSSYPVLRNSNELEKYLPVESQLNGSLALNFIINNFILVQIVP
jgi:hypothetical protein